MTGEVECRYYGRDFTAEEMALLRALIASPGRLSRHALSKEFCRRIGWIKPDGGFKGDCQIFCAWADFQTLTKRSPKMMANCVLASVHSRGGRFQAWAA